MTHVKDYAREAHQAHHFLTYADNYAIGYFKKQVIAPFQLKKGIHHRNHTGQIHLGGLY